MKEVVGEEWKMVELLDDLALGIEDLLSRSNTLEDL